LILLLLIATACAQEVAPPGEPQDEKPDREKADITIAGRPRQTFAGFGTSLTNFHGQFDRLKPEVRDQVSAAVWKDLNFKILRLWWSPAEYHKSGELGEFKKRYVDSGIIALAKKHGCTTLLLAPNEVPQAFAAPKIEETDSFTYFADEHLASYAKLLADFIAKAKAAGVTFNATGVLNEPNDRPIRFSIVQWPLMVTALRAELDARGLKDVAIIAPEAASADGWAEDVFDVLRKDDDAWQAVGAVATHTYNMGATGTLMRKSGGKPYWQTESSTPGPERDAAAEHVNAATSMARAIGDLNHGVTHWLWFVGYEQTDDTDNGTRLIRFDSTKPDGAVYRSAKYDWFKQLSDTIQPGATIHATSHRGTKKVEFTYGRKPELLAIGARNPDGTWGIALVNYTSDRFADLNDDERNQAGPDPGRTLELTIKVSGLKGDSARFAVRRSNEKARNAEDGVMEATNGFLKVKVAPLELVTLKSVP
jgi:O-glycosyl hydrolase